MHKYIIFGLTFGVLLLSHLKVIGVTHFSSHCIHIHCAEDMIWSEAVRATRADVIQSDNDFVYSIFTKPWEY